MAHFVRWVFIVFGVLALQSAMAMEGQSEVLSSIDQKIYSVQKTVEEVDNLGEYYQTVRQTLDFINVSAISPSDKYERLLSTATHAISLDFATKFRKDVVLREKRNIALFLVGAPLKEIGASEQYNSLRKSFAEALVEFVTGMQKDQIVDYQAKPVMINMPLEPGDASVQQERYKRFVAENRVNSENNRYQTSLNSELNFLRPRVKAFLENQYDQPEDKKDLDLFLNQLSS